MGNVCINEIYRECKKIGASKSAFYLCCRLNGLSSKQMSTFTGESRKDIVTHCESIDLNSIKHSLIVQNELAKKKDREKDTD